MCSCMHACVRACVHVCVCVCEINHKECHTAATHTHSYTGELSGVTVCPMRNYQESEL